MYPALYDLIQTPTIAKKQEFAWQWEPLTCDKGSAEQSDKATPYCSHKARSIWPNAAFRHKNQQICFEIKTLVHASRFTRKLARPKTGQKDRNWECHNHLNQSLWSRVRVSGLAALDQETLRVEFCIKSRSLSLPIRLNYIFALSLSLARSHQQLLTYHHYFIPHNLQRSNPILNLK